ncbi:MAG: lectin like domain-containing protein [Lachnospiraceae bacterium]
MKKKKKTGIQFMVSAFCVALGLTAWTGGTVHGALNLPVDTSRIDRYDGGRLPAGLDASYYGYPQNANVMMPFAMLPETYDLRDGNSNDFGRPVVTNVKDQNPWGACWAFGTTSSIESNAMIKDPSLNPDLSERFLAWFTMQLNHGEGYQTTAGKDKLLDFGGRRQMTTADYSSWSGPVDEATAPWENRAGAVGTPEEPGDWSLEDRLLAATPGTDAFHLQQVDYLPETGVFTGEGEAKTYTFDSNALVAIKQAIMTHGVLDVSYYASKTLPGQEPDPTTDIMNLETHAQYAPGPAPANHEVSVVGWDDTYSADNFIVKPQDSEGNPLNGAWIVKNSWGPGQEGSGAVDKDGYFYISYYDQTVSEFSAFQIDVQKNGRYQYDHNYQYDYLGMKSFSNVSPSPDTTGQSANVFTAEQDEKLTAVSAVTVNPGSAVVVEIYKIPSGAVFPNGELVSTEEAMIPYGGYHTIPLTTPVVLHKGEQFAVKETITGSGGGYLPLEMGDTKEISQGSKGSIKSIALADPGQSYMNDRADGWVDVTSIPKGEAYPGNVMIKAFTEDMDVAPTVSLMAESYNAAHRSLGRQLVTDLSLPMNLPALTQYITLEPTIAEGTGSITVDGAAYVSGTPILKEVLERVGAVCVDTVSAPRGNHSGHYSLSFTLQKESSVLTAPIVLLAAGGNATNPVAGSGSVHTGDRSSIFPWIAVMVLCGGAIVFLGLRSRNNKKKKKEE